MTVENPLRIALFFSNPAIGGAESFALAVGKEWLEAGHEVTIVNLWDGGGELKHRCVDFAIPFAELSCGQRRFRLGSIGQLRSWFRNNQCDIVLIFGLRLQLLMRVARPVLGTRAKWVTMIRGNDPWRRWPHVLADRWTQNGCQCHVGCSQAVCRTWLEREKYNPARMVHIPNGIDLSAFQTEGATWPGRSELGLPEEGLICTTVANLRPIKGHDYLVDSLVQCAGQLLERDIHFLWLGEDVNLWEGLRERLAAVGLDQRVIYPGPAADVRPYLANSDMFLLPSQSEGMPRAMMEAMAMGLPPIATAVGGTPEVLREGVEGHLVAYGDAETLGQRLISLIDDDATRERMSHAARERIHDHFDMKMVARAYLDLFEHVRGLAHREIPDAIGKFKRQSAYNSPE